MAVCSVYTPCTPLPLIKFERYWYRPEKVGIALCYFYLEHFLRNVVSCLLRTLWDVSDVYNR